MKNDDADRIAREVRQSDPARLARLLKLPDLVLPAGAGELNAILRHELTKPVQFDLTGLAPGAAEVTRERAEALGIVLRSFEDLLRHEHPPLELLQMLKQFAKAHRLRAGAIPADVATMLEYAALAAALLRHGSVRPLTQSDGPALREAFVWALGREWIEDWLRDLFRRALAQIES